MRYWIHSLKCSRWREKKTQPTWEIVTLRCLFGFFHSLNRFGEELWSLECSHIVPFRNKNACNRFHSWCNFFCAHFHYLCSHLMLFSFYLSRLFSVSFAQPVSLDLPVCLYFAQSVCISLGLSLFHLYSLYFSRSVYIFPVCFHLSQSVSIFPSLYPSLSLCLHLYF